MIGQCLASPVPVVMPVSTPTELVLMGDLGFADRGTAWREILDGAFELDGRMPVNPDGGLKSFGHPVGASGLRMLYECWLQFRGQAGERQLGDLGSPSPTTWAAGPAPACRSTR